MKTILYIAVILCLLPGALFAGDWILITNKDNPVNEISKADLKRVYLGKKKKVDGQTIVPIMLADNIAETEQFLSDILGMTVEKFKQHWLETQIKGLGTAPMIQKTATAAKLIVAGIPGAMTYINKGELDDTVKEIPVK